MYVILTVLASLFDLFQVGRLERGAQLLRGVDDDAAEGVEPVHQADVDPGQGDVRGFFLPLRIFLQNKVRVTQKSINNDAASFPLMDFQRCLFCTLHMQTKI